LITTSFQSRQTQNQLLPVWEHKALPNWEQDKSVRYWLRMTKPQHDRRYQALLKLLRELREGAGLSQRDLASRLDRQPSYVHKTEVGTRRADITEFDEWCRGCGINPEVGFKRLLKELA